MREASEQRGLRQLWADSPWTIKAFAVLEVVAIALSITTMSRETENGVDYMSSGSVIFWAALSGVLLYWLLRGSRLVWVVLTFWVAFSVVSSIAMLLVGPNDGYVFAAVWVALTVSEFVLLMHPLTRARCKRKLHLTDPVQ